jgi:hypothetical protein
VDGAFFVYHVLLFGSASSPDLWGRVASWVARMAASLFHPGELGLQVYVDDPIATTCGSDAERAWLFTIFLLWLSVVGLPIAWKKASCAVRVVWIGAEFFHSAGFIWVAIPPHRVEEVALTLADIHKRRRIPHRELQRLTGLLAFFGGIVSFLRPFVRIIWAAMSAAERSCREGAVCTVEVRRFRHGLQWLRRFFSNFRDKLSQRFELAAVVRDSRAEIAFDASLEGAGAILVVDGILKGWWADTWTSDDYSRFQLKSGDSGNMSLLEAITLLVVCRLWGHKCGSATVRVKGDNLSSLRLAIKLSSPKRGLNRVAMELAMDLAMQRYDLRLLEHIYGISNTLPDALSRHSEYTVPSVCDPSLRCFSVVRDTHFWSAS